MRIIQDLRLALRVFSRSPSATTIALIVAATAVSSLMVTGTGIATFLADGAFTCCRVPGGSDRLLSARLSCCQGQSRGGAALRFLPITDVSLDRRVLLFAFFTSLLTSVLFGVLSAFAGRKFDLRTAMGSRTSIAVERLGLRQTLITGEIALTVLLLAAAGLLIRTLVHLESLPPGFNATGVMIARASLDNVRYHDAAAFRKLLSESTDYMRQIPGVEYAAVGLSLPYERSLNVGGIAIKDGKEGGQKIMTDEAYVTPDYVSVVVLVQFVTLIAVTAPALRIARIDPAETLRVE
jgi:hypothetical protein